MRRGAIWGLLAAAAAAAGTLVVTPALIDALGVADFGLYVLILTLTSQAAFFDMGLPWAATRFFAEDLAHGRLDVLSSRFQTLSGFLVAVSAVAGAMAVALGPWLAQLSGAPVAGDFRLVTALAAISVALAFQTNLLQSVLRAAQRFDEGGRITFAACLMTPVASYVAIRLRSDLAALVAANLCVNVVILALLRVLARQYLPSGLAKGQSPERVREMLAFGGWSSVGRLATLVVLQIDRLFVAVLGSVAGLAYYAVAAQLAAKVNLLGGVTTNLFFSKASWLQATDRLNELREAHASGRRILMWVALATTLPVVAFGPVFLETWIGAEMRTAGGTILILLAIGHAIVSVTSLDAAVLEGSGRPDLTAKTMLGWVPVAAFAGVVLYPWLHAAAIAAAVALWLAGVGITTIVLKTQVLGRSPVRSGHRLFAGVALVVALALATRALVNPLLGDLLSVLTAMALTGAITAAAGLFTILDHADRQLLFARRRGAESGVPAMAPATVPVQS
jgi:O-antigen/teichoic acid export membrane protein